MIRRLSMSLSAVMPLVFFVRMIHSGVKPDSYTFPFLFKSWAKLASAHGGKQIRADAISFTAPIAGYAMWGNTDRARKVFGEMPVRDVVSWNAMVAGYGQTSRSKRDP
ncbi:Pentatricopeptide repeat-containing protein, chloroplastic, partial [Cucurbita argyrosperma subsp. sororia]